MYYQLLFTEFRVFHKRLTSGRIFNNRLLFFLLFSGNFCGGDKALIEEDKVSPLGKPWN